MEMVKDDKTIIFRAIRIRCYSDKCVIVQKDHKNDRPLLEAIDSRRPINADQ